MGRTASAAKNTGKNKGADKDVAPEVVKAAANAPEPKVNLDRENVRKPPKTRQVPAGTMSAGAKMEEATDDKHEVTEEQRQGDRRADDIAKRDAFAQMAQQLSGASEPTEAQKKQAAFEAELKALQEKHGIVANVKVKAAKADKTQQNGVTRPAPTSLCGKIWATADAISLAHHGVAAIASLREHPDMKGVNDHTIKTQYAKWRLFNGIKGRLPTLPAHAVQQVEGVYPEAEHKIVSTAPAEPAAPEAEAPAE